MGVGVELQSQTYLAMVQAPITGSMHCFTNDLERGPNLRFALGMLPPASTEDHQGLAVYPIHELLLISRVQYSKSSFVTVSTMTMKM